MPPKMQTFSFTLPGCCVGGEAGDAVGFHHACSAALKLAVHAGDAVALPLSYL